MQVAPSRGRRAGGRVVVRVVYLHDKGPGSGSFQLSHETCSITDCRGKEQKTKDTHTINPKCNMLVTPTLQPTFPQRSTRGRRAHAEGEGARAALFLEGSRRRHELGTCKEQSRWGRTDPAGCRSEGIHPCPACCGPGPLLSLAGDGPTAGRGTHSVRSPWNWPSRVSAWGR